MFISRYTLQRGAKGVGGANFIQTMKISVFYLVSLILKTPSSKIFFSGGRYQ